MKRLILLIIAGMLLTSPAWAANQICDENFEGVALGDITRYDPTGSGEIPQCGRPFYGQGVYHPDDELPVPPADGAFVIDELDPSGENQCAMGFISSTTLSEESGHGYKSYSQPKWRFDNRIGGSQELYMKFDLRLGEDLGDKAMESLGDSSGDTNEINDLKFVSFSDFINTATGNGAWNPIIILRPNSAGYGLYKWTDPDNDIYEGCEYSSATVKEPNHAYDHNWHTYEVYVNIGTEVAVDTGEVEPHGDGIVRIWEDGNLILEDMRVPLRAFPDEGLEINSAEFIRHTKYLNSAAEEYLGIPLSGHIYFDNIEVWDGMPDADYAGELIARFSNTDNYLSIARKGEAKVQVAYTNTGDAGDITLKIDAYKDGNLVKSNLKTTTVSLGSGESIQYANVQIPTDVKSATYELRVCAEAGGELIEGCEVPLTLVIE